MTLLVACDAMIQFVHNFQFKYSISMGSTKQYCDSPQFFRNFSMSPIRFVLRACDGIRGEQCIQLKCDYKIYCGRFSFVKGYQQCVPTTYAPHYTYTWFEWERTHKYIKSFPSAAAATVALKLLFSLCPRLRRWKKNGISTVVSRELYFQKNSVTELNRRSLNRWAQSNGRISSVDFFSGKKCREFNSFSLLLCAFRRMQSIHFFYVWKISCESDEWKIASHALQFRKAETAVYDYMAV